jgi:hypothetical protein
MVEKSSRKRFMALVLAFGMTRAKSSPVAGQIAAKI